MFCVWQFETSPNLPHQMGEAEGVRVRPTSVLVRPGYWSLGSNGSGAAWRNGYVITVTTTRTHTTPMPATTRTLEVVTFCSWECLFEVVMLPLSTLSMDVSSHADVTEMGLAVDVLVAIPASDKNADDVDSTDAGHAAAATPDSSIATASAILDENRRQPMGAMVILRSFWCQLEQ